MTPTSGDDRIRTRRALRSALILLGITLVCGWAVIRYQTPTKTGGQAGPAGDVPSRPMTIASLSPAVTEVVFALGASERLVAVSDYCVIPEGSSLARAGTALTPNYEVLARLEPDIILAEESTQAPRTELEALAPTRMLPWLTIRELVQAIRSIGEVAGEPAIAESLATRVETALDVPIPADGPRVLFVMSHDPGQLSECWFIRDDSIHGAALRAAGARNAVPDAVEGLPRLSLERVLEIDPDAIIVLCPRAESRKLEEQMLEDWSSLSPLRAARTQSITVVSGDSLYFTGPAVLRLVDRLEAAMHALPESRR